MNWGRAPGVLLGGGVSLAPPFPVSKSHPASAAEQRSCPKFLLSFRDIFFFFLVQKRQRRGLVSAPEGSPGAISWGSCGDTESALPPAPGHAAPVVSLDASATAGGFPPSVATPSSAVNGFWKPSVPAPSGLGLRLRSRISLCSLCHLSQRKSRQGDRQVGTSAR